MIIMVMMMFMVMIVLMSLWNICKAPWRNSLSGLQLSMHSLICSGRCCDVTGPGPDAFGGAVLLGWVAPGHRMISMEFGCAATSTDRLATASKGPEEWNRPPRGLPGAVVLDVGAALMATVRDVLRGWFWNHKREQKFNTTFGLLLVRILIILNYQLQTGNCSSQSQPDPDSGSYVLCSHLQSSALSLEHPCCRSSVLWRKKRKIGMINYWLSSFIFFAIVVLLLYLLSNAHW